MKKNKIFYLLFAIIFVLPVFMFSCNEVKFEDVVYYLSSITKEEVIDKIDEARSSAISNGVKLQLETITDYKFYETSNELYSSKKIRKQSKSFIGKDVDECIFTESEDFIKDDIINYTLERTVDKENKNSVSSANLYTLKMSYQDGDKEKADSVYNKQEINYVPSVTLNSIYENIVKKIEVNDIDLIYEKSFNGIRYYRLESKYDGLTNIKNKFEINANLEEAPNLFQKNNATDFIMDFSCEFGIKDSSGTSYINYFKLNYKLYAVINNKFEKYLSVSSKSTLEKYGDEVVVETVSDKGEYVANTFVNTLNSDTFYCEYEQNSNTLDNETFVVLKLAKEKLDNSQNVKYYDFSIKERKKSSDSSSYEDVYYYIDGNTSKCYKITDKNNKKWQEDANFHLALLDFDFTLKYQNKVKVNEKSYYLFSNNVNNFEVYYNEQANEVEKISKDSNTNLVIKSYGIDNNLLDVIYDASGYSEEVKEG